MVSAQLTDSSAKTWVGLFTADESSSQKNDYEHRLPVKPTKTFSLLHITMATDLPWGRPLECTDMLQLQNLTDSMWCVNYSWNKLYDLLGETHQRIQVPAVSIESLKV